MEMTQWPWLVPFEKGGKYGKNGTKHKKSTTTKKKRCLWRSTIFDHLPPFGFGDYINVCS